MDNSRHFIILDYLLFDLPAKIVIDKRFRNLRVFIPSYCNIVDACAGASCKTYKEAFQKAIRSLENGHTYYTANAGLKELKTEAGKRVMRKS